MSIIRTQAVTAQLSLSGVHLSFPDVTIKAKEKVLLLGPSGCGKTTLLSMMAGLLTPSSGQVFIQDQDVYNLRMEARDRLRGQNFGFVFQSLHLISSMSVEQNIMLAAKMANIPVTQERFNYIVNELGLENLITRKPLEISQGEQQRAALARALIHSPMIVIADEPTSALDDKNTDSVMELIEHQVAKSNAALLVATHDQRIVSRFDRVISLS